MISRLTVTLLAALVLLPAQLSAGRILVWATGNSFGDTPGVASWLAASGQFTAVDYVNDGPVSLPTLQTYDGVLFFTNSGGDPANGDVLADYADGGGYLVLATFSWANQGSNTLGGRIVSDGLSPFYYTGSSLYTTATMQSNDGSAFFTGVSGVQGYYRDDVALNPGALLRASWSDGVPLLATRGNVVAVNLFPDDSFGTVSGDHRQLFINTMAFGAGAPIPEPSTWVLALAGVGLMAFIRRR